MTDFVESEIEKIDQADSFEDSSDIQEYYDKLRILFESTSLDVAKSTKGNKAAGVRLRKSMRVLKKELGSFIKFTLNN